MVTRNTGIKETRNFNCVINKGDEQSLTGHDDNMCALEHVRRRSISSTSGNLHILVI